MTSLKISAPARSDLDEIWVYIARDNIMAADRLLAQFHEKFLMIVRQPLIGEGCEELAPGLRNFPVGNYAISYRPSARSVQIVRVLHGARDVTALF